MRVAAPRPPRSMACTTRGGRPAAVSHQQQQQLALFCGRSAVQSRDHIGTTVARRALPSAVATACELRAASSSTRAPPPTPATPQQQQHALCSERSAVPPRDHIGTTLASRVLPSALIANACELRVASHPPPPEHRSHACDAPPATACTVQRTFSSSFQRSHRCRAGQPRASLRRGECMQTPLRQQPPPHHPCNTPVTALMPLGPVAAAPRTPSPRRVLASAEWVAARAKSRPTKRRAPRGPLPSTEPKPNRRW